MNFVISFSEFANNVSHSPPGLSAHMHCFLATSNTVSICLILIFLQQFSSFYPLMSKRMIWIYTRFYNFNAKHLCFCFCFGIFDCRGYQAIVFKQYNKEQAELAVTNLAQSNFAIIRKEGQPILDLVGNLSPWLSTLASSHPFILLPALFAMLVKVICTF